MRKPLVALVGRPNVGKSTLFNRLIGEQRAVTSDVPGTTRDRILGDSDWRGVTFTVIDTGGIEIYDPRRGGAPLSEASPDFVEEIRGQAVLAIEEADLVLMLVDASQGITSADEEVADILRRTEKPVIIAANKADNEARRIDALEFYGLGLGEEVYAMSALHGTGTGDLLDAVVDALQNAPPEVLGDDAEDDSLKIAIVGRPNVGKSSLLNRLLGEERAIVSPIAGTTRDAIDTHLTWEGLPITLIDTAGIRRRGSIAPGIENYAVIRAYKALERADVALLLLDAEEGITAQDTHIAGLIKDAHRSVVIVVNKWDAVEKDEHSMDEFTKNIRQRFDFIAYAPIVFISAKTGQRIHTVLPTAARVQEERLIRIPTSTLNKVLREAVAKHAPTSRTGRELKIYYASQVRVDPPTFLFHVNDATLLHFSYERYLENQLREKYGFLGTPIRLSFRNRPRSERK